jgi:hypothetical protein
LHFKPDSSGNTFYQVPFRGFRGKKIVTDSGTNFNFVVGFALLKLEKLSFMN